jgi:hypothetical protein
MKKHRVRTLLRNFLIELVLYGILIIIYSFIAFRFLGGMLTQTFRDSRLLYAIIGLGLIVAQSALLDIITSFLLDRLKLGRMEDGKGPH